MSLNCRYLYAFVWHNVGYLNDEFFGMFLAFTNAFLSFYFGVFATVTSDYQTSFLFKVCVTKGLSEEEGDVRETLNSALNSGGIHCYHVVHKLSFEAELFPQEVLSKL